MNYKVEKNGVSIYLKHGILKVQPVNKKIIRIIYSKKRVGESESIIIDHNSFINVDFDVIESEFDLVVKMSELSVSFNKNTKKLSYFDENGKCLLREGSRELHEIDILEYSTGGDKPIINRVKTPDGERNFVGNLIPQITHKAFSGKLHFEFEDGEGIYGLGQGEEGIYNYRGTTQYLYQHNMRIPMPMFLSDSGYGMLFDCGSLMIFNDSKPYSYMFCDSIPHLEYYFVAGEKPDNVIDGFRKLTGQATMFPRWVFGYIQSKEQYYSAKELEDIVTKHRELNVPIDCVVQDWNTWEDGKWGNKILDKSRYGDIKECIDNIHKMNAHTMVSIWPNMNAGCENHDEFIKNDQLLFDYATYDAFDKEARKIYWKQAKEGLYDVGFDSWWCDSVEPFSSPDWTGSQLRKPRERYYLVGTEHKKYLKSEQANLYPLVHSMGIYNNQIEDFKNNRVVNLTRSGYASSQKYSAFLWSGDITATYDTMKKQIVEGLNMGLSGYPYWTLDIGGFFVVKENWRNRGCKCSDNSDKFWFWKGDYEDGIDDPAYCELYVRWIQMGAFLPMFRSHGTDTPREIWNFGEEGDMFYDSIKRFIDIRYKLIPYIYSIAGSVRLFNKTIMRSLLFDFSHDEKARTIKSQFMMGESIMVCPITKPMYFDIGGVEIATKKQISCYLPEGCGWYDFYTNKYYKGGIELVVDTPIDVMPIFIKAGSIIPMRPGIQFADERANEGYEIHIYPNADGEFLMYEDDGKSNDYEKDRYSITRILWNDKSSTLIIDDRNGDFNGMPMSIKIDVVMNNKIKNTIVFCGKKIELIVK
ncbi:MAG: DUF5110 domain-containing protein [Spirochaetaceae bacterium]